MLRRFVCLSLLLALTGCATMIPDYERPAAPVADAWPQKDSGQQDAVPAVDLPWRQYFTGSTLQQVIALALENNPDQRIALLNIEKAQAQYRISRANLYPAIDGRAGSTARRVPADLSSSGQGDIQHQYTVDLGVSSYELDLFGRVRSLREQALEQFLATEQAQRSVQLSLVSRVALGWLTLAADRERLALVRETLENQQQAYDLVNRRYKAGVSSILDLQRAQTSVDAARVDLANLGSLVAQDQNALQLLVGAPLPDDLLPPVLAASLPQLTPGLPSEVLLQRPDILQAESELKSANANIGAARAAFFPRIALVSSIGTGSNALSGLFKDDSLSWNFTSGVTLPIFNYGSNQARLKSAEIERDIAVARYEKAIQTAFREVADALARKATIDDQLEAQQSLTEATAESYRLAKVRYDKGLDSYLGVLDAQRALYNAQQGLINTRLIRLANQVTLYQVLGGGSS